MVAGGGTWATAFLPPGPSLEQQPSGSLVVVEVCGVWCVWCRPEGWLPPPQGISLLFPTQLLFYFFDWSCGLSCVISRSVLIPGARGRARPHVLGDLVYLSSEKRLCAFIFLCRNCFCSRLSIQFSLKGLPLTKVWFQSCLSVDRDSNPGTVAVTFMHLVTC
jgi:hypothetical protein